MATTNPWKRFIGLLPGGVRTVGIVRSVSTSQGTSVVELRNGARVIVRGADIAAGGSAYIADGALTGAAPDLPHYDVDV